MLTLAIVILIFFKFVFIHFVTYIVTRLAKVSSIELRVKMFASSQIRVFFLSESIFLSKLLLTSIIVEWTIFTHRNLIFYRNIVAYLYIHIRVYYNLCIRLSGKCLSSVNGLFTTMHLPFVIFYKKQLQLSYKTTNF